MHYHDVILYQIEEKIPVQVCKTVRLNQESISISRGQEGEKRRKPVVGKKSTGIYFNKKKSVTGEQSLHLWDSQNGFGLS